MAEENKAVDTSVQAEAVQPKKSEKVQKDHKKPGFFSRVVKWFRELKSEAKKVVWPNGKQVVKNTIVVIVVAVAVCVLVTVLDVVFGSVRDLIARLVS
jgi:preprotein translocase subunit SecE